MATQGNPLAQLLLGAQTGLEIRQWMVVAACAVAIVLITLSMVRRRTRRQYERSPTAEARDRYVGDREASQRDMRQLIIELDELARRINAQIDTKFAKLEQSVADADRRIAELKRLLGSDASDVASSNDGQLDVLVTDADEPPDAAAPAASSAPSVSPRKAIYDLADAGMSASEIARQTGQLVGEIELILNLRARH